MARGIKSDTGNPLSHHLHMMISDAEVEAIENWMFANRVRSRSDAIRQLVAYALEQKAKEGGVQTP